MPFLRRHAPLASETDIRNAAVGMSSPAQSSMDALADADSGIEPDPVTNRRKESYASGSLSIPARAVDNSSQGSSTSQPRDHTSSRPSSPPQEQTHRHRRFSVLRFRNASDSQLSMRAKHEAENPPPLPTPRMSDYLPHNKRICSALGLTSTYYSSGNHHDCSNRGFRGFTKKTFPDEFSKSLSPFRSPYQVKR